MKPLDGIRVVDMSTMLAGPMTGRILAEWGADVIKVETMNGDAWRKQAQIALSKYQLGEVGWEELERIMRKTL